jgi:ATP-dependent DNA ligase
MKKDKSNIEINVTVKVFDIMYLNGEHLFDEPYKKRRKVLENLFVGRKIKQKINFDLKELKKLCQNFEY